MHALSAVNPRSTCRPQTATTGRVVCTSPADASGGAYRDGVFVSVLGLGLGLGQTPGPILAADRPLLADVVAKLVDA